MILSSLSILKVFFIIQCSVHLLLFQLSHFETAGSGAELRRALGVYPIVLNTVGALLIITNNAKVLEQGNMIILYLKDSYPTVKEHIPFHLSLQTFNLLEIQKRKHNNSHNSKGWSPLAQPTLVINLSLRH